MRHLHQPRKTGAALRMSDRTPAHRTAGSRWTGCGTATKPHVSNCLRATPQPRSPRGTAVAICKPVVAVVLGSVAASGTYEARSSLRRAGGREVMKLFTLLRKLRKNDSGQDLLEYALLVAL